MDNHRQHLSSAGFQSYVLSSDTSISIYIFSFCHIISDHFVCPSILRSLMLHCCLVCLTFFFFFFKIHFFQFLTPVSSVISPNPPTTYPIPLLFFTCLPPVSFLSIFLRFSITLSPLLIPLADPQREPREWVGLKRERRAVLYPARSSLARLKRSEEREKRRRKTTHGRGELFPLSPFLFPPPLYSSLSSLLSCLISHFYSSSAEARI